MADGALVLLLQDVSPLVRGMAVWALSRLAPARLAGKGGGETDTHVLAEWALAAPAIDAGRAA